MSSPLKILVFSHRPEVRERIVTAVGRRPAADIGRVTYHESATIADVLMEMDAGTVDLAILDGEAQPTGGMGICRQMKYEIEDCPAVCILLGRRDDRWLATWALADATIDRPLDPVAAAETVAQLLRDHARGVPVLR